MAEVVRIARSVGIAEATTSEVFVHGLDVKRILFSVETSTPKARALTQALMNEGAPANTGFTLTSREVRAIVGGAPVETVTKPMSEPFPDVVQDLGKSATSPGATSGEPFPVRFFSGPAL